MYEPTVYRHLLSGNQYGALNERSKVTPMMLCPSHPLTLYLQKVSCLVQAGISLPELCCPSEAEGDQALWSCKAEFWKDGATQGKRCRNFFCGCLEFVLNAKLLVLNKTPRTNKQQCMNGGIIFRAQFRSGDDHELINKVRIFLLITWGH